MIDRHEWSGKNRHKARNQAAESLRQDLMFYPDPTVIIAHSHGGNVAQMALGWDDSLQARTRVIAVGTPFLHFQDLRHDPDIHHGPLLSFGRIFWLTFSATMGMVLSLSLLAFDRQPGPAARESGQTSYWSTWEPLNGFSEVVGVLTLAVFGLAVLALFFLGAVGTMSLVASLWRPPAAILGGLNPWASRRAPGWHAEGRDRGRDPSPGVGVAPRFVPLDPSPPPITTIRTRNDEAATALRLGTGLASLVDRSRWVLDRMPTWVALPTFLVAMAVVGALAIAGPGGPWIVVPAFIALSGFPHPEIVSVVAAVATVPAAFALAVTLLALLEALACGFDGVRLLAHGRVSMRAEPRRQGTAHVAQLGRGRGVSLRHCRLMEDAGSVQVIVDACEASLRSLDALSDARQPSEDT